jgi:hypothetical protein
VPEVEVVHADDLVMEMRLDSRSAVVALTHETVGKAPAAEQVACIQGPPGTALPAAGKTTWPNAPVPLAIE